MSELYREQELITRTTVEVIHFNEEMKELLTEFYKLTLKMTGANTYAIKVTAKQVIEDFENYYLINKFREKEIAERNEDVIKIEEVE